MKVYLYDDETKEFLREEEAFVDPLETKKQGKKVYLLPANATFKEPKETKQGKAIVFNGEEWVFVDDNRGKYTIKDNQIQEIKTLEPVERILTDEEIKGLESGELIISENEIVKKPDPTRDEISERRRQLYIAQKDPLTCQIQALRDEPQTEEILNEIESLQEERKRVVEKIKNENPYPVES